MTETMINVFGWIRGAFRGSERDRIGHSTKWKLGIRLTPDALDGGWIAECTSLPGCLAQGETRDEAMDNLVDAMTDIIHARIRGHIPDLHTGGEDQSRDLALSI